MLVKGISRQVIVVQSPDPKLFEQAIFILKEEAIGQEGVTEEALLKEANRIINRPQSHRGRRYLLSYLLWAFSGALATGVLWMLTVLF